MQFLLFANAGFFLQHAGPQLTNNFLTYAFLFGRHADLDLTFFWISVIISLFSREVAGHLNHFNSRGWETIRLLTELKKGERNEFH